MEVLNEKKEDKQMLMYLHLSQLLFLFTGFGGIIAAIVIWQTKKDEVMDMDEHGKMVVNFQISLMIYGIIAGILMFVLVGLLLFPIIWIGALVLPIMNGIKANDGKPVNYPLTIKFIK
ncbi:DUF4870 domain-containing protein [Mesonia aestuariivivens]|uniref:DUF4870 domain-containing protein n=1 Tax=Mesonia aestuariivivens TaxID=2796128 RepID=A0ABS6W541_9FLAO|nr:DUF4870 domain-containing protein [Mesonia aestuariivivens]MBW2962992.1 DUF4870 domain-containing protein [Mesonia aestuariivivens]